MKRMLLYSFLFLLTFSVTAQKKSIWKESEIAKLISNQQSFELIKKYKEYQDSLSPFISLCAQIHLAQNFNQEEKAIKLIDSLLILCPQATETTLNYNVIKASLLLSSGQYNKLYHFSDSVIEQCKNDSINSYMPIFSYYQNQCKSFKNAPPIEIIKPKKNSYIPISRGNSLIHLDIKVNQIPVKDCLFDTGAGLSMFKEQAIQNAGIKIFEDTLTVDHATLGSVKYRPALIDSLDIGGIILKNIPVGVICSNQIFIEEQAVIGIQIIKCLKKIIFTPTQLIVPYHTVGHDFAPNIMLKNNCIYIHSTYEGQELDFYFDTGAYFNHLQNNISTDTTNNWQDIILNIDNQASSLSFWIHPEYTFYEGDGLLGTPFIRSFNKVILDLENMQIQTDSFVGYTPPHKYFSTHNYWRIAELEEHHCFDGQEKYTMKILSYWGKNNPQQTIAYIDTLLNNYYYPLNILQSSARMNLCFMLSIKISALYNLGQYKEAYKIAQSTINDFPEAFDSFIDITHRLRALKAYPPTEIKLATPCRIINMDKRLKHGIAIPIQINGKREKAIIDLGSSMCWMTEDYVSKLKVKIIADSILLDNQKVKMGIIDRLELGNVVANNVVFYIQRQPSDHIIIGQSLLSKIPQINIKPNQEITFNTENTNRIYTDSLPLRLQNSTLITQLKFNDLPVTIEINNQPDIFLDKSLNAQGFLFFGKGKFNLAEMQLKDMNFPQIGIMGTVGFIDILKQKKEMTFDFEKMKIFFHDNMSD